MNEHALVSTTLMLLHLTFIVWREGLTLQELSFAEVFLKKTLCSTTKARNQYDYKALEVVHLAGM